MAGLRAPPLHPANAKFPIMHSFQCHPHLGAHATASLKHTDVSLSRAGPGILFSDRQLCRRWFYTTVPYTEPTYTFSGNFGGELEVSPGTLHRTGWRCIYNECVGSRCAFAAVYTMSVCGSLCAFAAVYTMSVCVAPFVPSLLCIQ